MTALLYPRALLTNTCVRLGIRVHVAPNESSYVDIGKLHLADFYNLCGFEAIIIEFPIHLLFICLFVS